MHPPGGARVYGLDFIVPDRSTSFETPQLVDFNGARSSCAGQFDLYGDHRVQSAVLSHIVETCGGLVAISQVTSHPDQLLFDAESVRAKIGPQAGIYAAHSSFVPEGDPHSRDSDAYVSHVAAEMGIPYSHVELRWAPERSEFLVEEPCGSVTPYAEWRTNLPLWPYSFDQRAFYLNASKVTNPLPFYVAASNKVLAYHLIGGSLAEVIPPYELVGLWSKEGETPRRTAERFTTELLVVKPASSLRGFGVVVVPREALPLVAAELGLAGTEDALSVATSFMAPALLWSDAAELLSVAQAYVQSAPKIHPDTGLPHTAIHRATVLCSDVHAPRCIDVSVVLSPLPITGVQTRNSLIVAASLAEKLMAPNDREYDLVKERAETVVACFEAQARKFFLGCDDAQIVLKEADFLADEIERTSDVGFQDLWAEFRTSVSLQELMRAPRP